MDSHSIGLAVFVVGLLILAFAWIVLPLALFGTKPLLREILAEMKRMNALLEKDPARRA